MDFEIDVESDTGSFYSSDQEVQDKYARKYDVIYKRCESIEKENHMLALRLMKLKKRVQRLRKERRFLIQFLEKRDDKFRSVPINVSLDDDKILPSPEMQRKG